MSANPEQPVLDAIDELVEWQLEEGRRRGDGPAGLVDPAELRPAWLEGPGWRAMAAAPGFTPQDQRIPVRVGSSSSPVIDSITPVVE